MTLKDAHNFYKRNLPDMLKQAVQEIEQDGYDNNDVQTTLRSLHGELGRALAAEFFDKAWGDD